MPDPNLLARSALGPLTAAGPVGAAVGSAGLLVEERRDLGLASVIARRGRTVDLAAACQRAYGIEPPSEPRYVAGSTLALAWAGPDQWLAVSEALPDGELASELRARLAGLASVADQSDGRAVLRLSGPNLRDVLAKGVPLDLHPRVFGAGAAAVTVVAQIGVHLWRPDAGPAFEVAIPRGYAASFWRWLAASAAEFGFEVIGRSPPDM